MRQPWLKFYPQDWLSDEKLGMCSCNAQGLWMRMLCLMHRSQRVGTIPLIKDKAPSIEQLAGMLSVSVGEVAQGLKELDQAGVFSRDKNGVIFSRRMKKDERAREKFQKFGALGGNPALIANGTKHNKDNGLEVNPPLNPGVNRGVKPRARAILLESESELECSDSARARPREADPGNGKQAGQDLAYELAGMTGMTLSSPRSVMAAVNQAQQWLGDGIPAETCRHVIQACIDKGDQQNTRSLRRFDAVIRADHARDGGLPPPPKPPSISRQIKFFEDQAHRMRDLGDVQAEVEFLAKAEALKARAG